MLRRPRWVIGTVIVVILAVVFVNLGLWQLRRLDERQRLNELIEARTEDVRALPDGGWRDEVDVEDLVFTRVRLEGEFDPGSEFLVRFRVRGAQPGFDVVTPFVTDAGVVLVERGWVPQRLGEEWREERTPPPEGEVEIEGVLVRPEDRGASFDAARGGVPVAGALAPDALEDELPYDDVYALPVQLDPAGDGDPNAFPLPPVLPALDEGPHLSYAIQWFSFAAIVTVGWVVLLFRTARREPEHS